MNSYFLTENYFFLAFVKPSFLPCHHCHRTFLRGFWCHQDPEPTDKEWIKRVERLETSWGMAQQILPSGLACFYGNIRQSFSTWRRPQTCLRKLKMVCGDWEDSEYIFRKIKRIGETGELFWLTGELITVGTFFVILMQKFTIFYTINLSIQDTS